MNTKATIDTIDGVALRIASGIYELSEPVYHWLEGERFVVEKHTEHIGEQTAYQYYTIRRFNRRLYQAKSYETEKWNALVSRFVPADE